MRIPPINLHNVNLVAAWVGYYLPRQIQLDATKKGKKHEKTDSSNRTQRSNNRRGNVPL